MHRPSPRTVGYVAAWLIAATVAVAVGLLAVTGVGASVRDRGPLTGEAQAVREAREDRDVDAVPDPDAERVSGSFDGEFGIFEVTCQGAFAFGVEAEPAPGWRTVSYEQGPKDDVEAVFSSGARAAEIEVFCNGGRPTLGDLDLLTLPVEDD